MHTHTLNGATRSWQLVDRGPLFPSMAALMEAAGHLDAHAPGADTSSVSEVPSAAPPPGMSISSLPTGVLLSRAALAFSGGRFDDVRRFALTGLLVRHPRGDLLFDTGMGSQWARHREALPWLMRRTTRIIPGLPAQAQLRTQGYDFARLAGIVLTHAHWDHVSGAQDFSGTSLWLSEEEDRFIGSGHRSMRVAAQVTQADGGGAVPRRPFRMVGGPYLGFAQSLDVWSDGSVVLVPAPGHTPGSIMAFIALPSGRRLVLLGDVVWQMEGVERGVERPWLSRMLVDQSPEDVRRLIGALSRLHRQHPHWTMLPAHDERAMASVPVWPAFAA